MSQMGYYLLTMAIYAGLNGILVLGLDMQFGVTGIFNFAYILLVAVGAYATGIAALPPPTPGGPQYIAGFGWPFPWDILFGIGMTVLFSLGLALIVFRRIANWYLALTLSAIAWALFVLTTNYVPLFNGLIGLTGVSGPGQGRLDPATYQWVFLAIVVVSLVACFVVMWRVEGAPLGRALRSTREDSVALGSLGKSPIGLKTVGFLLGGAAAGLGGGLSIIYLGGWSPQSWGSGETFILLSAVIIGGRGWAAGAFLGSIIVLEAIIEGSRFFPDVAGRPDMLPALQAVAIGLLLLAVLWWRPFGLWPEPKTRFPQ